MTKKLNEINNVLTQANKIFSADFIAKHSSNEVDKLAKDYSLNLQQLRTRVSEIFLENLTLANTQPDATQRTEMLETLDAHWVDELKGLDTQEELDQTVMRLDRYTANRAEIKEQEAKDLALATALAAQNSQNTSANNSTQAKSQPQTPPPSTSGQPTSQINFTSAQPNLFQQANTSQQATIQNTGQVLTAGVATQHNLQQPTNIALQNMQQPAGAATQFNAQPYVPQIKLPTIQLKEFYGEKHNFQEFISIYDAAIHNNINLGEFDKLITLKSLLKGDASHIIKSIPLATGMYQKAYDIVTKRFANALNTRSSLVRELERIPVASNHPRNLRKTLDIINSHFVTLSTYDASLEKCSLTVEAIKNKFPLNVKTELTRREWKNTSVYDMNGVLTELESIVAEEEVFALATGNTSEGETSNFFVESERR